MGQYIKIDDSWKHIKAVYKKVNGHWVKQEQYDFDDTVYMYSGDPIDFDVFLIVAEDAYTGRQFYLVATLNDTRVYPNWSITSGNQYATVNSNGKVTILQGASNNPITVRASYDYHNTSKSISVSYSNQLTIEGADIMTGTSGNVIALYNSTVVNPTWSITSGGQYASINQSGEITIINSGEITVSATYENITVTKVITLVYDASMSSQTSVNPDTGAITTTETTTTTDPETGAVTESSSSTTTNADGSTSETTSETTTNTDGSTSTTTSTVNSDGSSSETTSSTSTDPETGAVTEIATSTTTNADGTSSETEYTQVTNEDGSSSTQSSSTNYDENGNLTSSQESTVNVSAADSEGTVTTSTSTSTTNTDGTSSEYTSTMEQYEDGSSSSNSETLNYDENGDLTGSTTNNTDVNADGSSSSSTTNYNASGDPTDQQNVDTDVTGNIDTQDIEFDENGDPTVTGYNIDTTASEGEGKEITGDGVNTEFVPFDDNNAGFVCHIRFKSIQGEQPRPPIVEDTDDTGTNYLYNILCAKSTVAVNSKYPGFEIRWTLAKSNGAAPSGSGNGLQFRYAPAGAGNSTANLTPDENDEYDLTITYDPNKTKNNKQFIVTSSLNSLTTISKDIVFATNNIDFTLGYAINSQGLPFRYAGVTIYEFSVTKL